MHLTLSDILKEIKKKKKIAIIFILLATLSYPAKFSLQQKNVSITLIIDNLSYLSEQHPIFGFVTSRYQILVLDRYKKEYNCRFKTFDNSKFNIIQCDFDKTKNWLNNQNIQENLITMYETVLNASILHSEALSYQANNSRTGNFLGAMTAESAKKIIQREINRKEFLKISISSEKIGFDYIEFLGFFFSILSIFTGFIILNTKPK